jgi:hypothetical protein
VDLQGNFPNWFLYLNLANDEKKLILSPLPLAGEGSPVPLFKDYKRRDAARRQGRVDTILI